MSHLLLGLCKWLRIVLHNPSILLNPILTKDALSTMIHVGSTQNLFGLLFLYNKRKNTNTTMYLEKSKFEMSQVTTLALRKLWNSWNRSYLRRWCFCVNITLKIHLQPLTASHHSSWSPYIFYNKCSHLLQQKLPGNNHCPTQNNSKVPAPTKTTTDNIVNLESDGCFLKVLLALAST
jgi:hypothetical protein